MALCVSLLRVQTGSSLFPDDICIDCIALLWIELNRLPADLEILPDYQLLTATLKKSGRMLKSLMFSFVLVLAGSGQGFFMAFGTHLYSFRSVTESILGLLRMAVGDFDYNDLQSSQPVLGPIMFWVYIFLVFFVLMSMFIALIAEAFEEAKDEQSANAAKHHVSIRKLKLLSTKRLLEEARNRRNLSAFSFEPSSGEAYHEPEQGMGLVSKSFIRQLHPFDKAVKVFMKELDRVERIEETQKARDELNKTKSQRQRRASVVELAAGPSFIVGGGIGHAVVSGELSAWWESSAIRTYLRSKLYWTPVEQTVAGQPRKVADWFERIELSSHGKKYKATENYRQKTTKELDYNAGNVIVIVKKEVDKEVIGKDGQKTLKKGAWMGYREADGAGLNRIVRNHHTLEEIIEDSDEHNAPPVDLGEDGAVSEQEESDDDSSDDDDQAESEDELQVVAAGSSIFLGGTSGGGAGGESSDDDDIANGLHGSALRTNGAMIQSKKGGAGGGRGRQQTMFGNPAQAHTYGTDADLPELDGLVAPVPAALGGDRQVQQQLNEAQRRIKQLEREAQAYKHQLEERELEVESLRTSPSAGAGSDETVLAGGNGGGGGGGGGGSSPEDSKMISEIHEMLSAKKKFEDKTWTAKGGIARAILEDHDKTRKIETTLRTAMRKLDAIEAAGVGGGGGGGGGGAALPGTVVQWTLEDGGGGGMQGGGGASRNNFIETPSTRLRRVEHKDEAAIELERRRKQLATR